MKKERRGEYERHSNLQRKLTMFSSHSLLRGSLVIEWCIPHSEVFHFNFASRLHYFARETKKDGLDALKNADRRLIHVAKFL